MASIIGGIGTSHVPTIGVAFDQGKQADPDWAPLFRGYQPVATWLAEKQPDLLFFCFNDHATTFFFDHYPTFALGVSAEYAIADEGLGPRPIPPLKGHAPFAWGKTVAEATYHAVVLEEIANLARETLLANPNAKPISKAMSDKHYYRKHGASATYGQQKH